jgi:hypothetical protein
MTDCPDRSGARIRGIPAAAARDERTTVPWRDAARALLRNRHVDMQTRAAPGKDGHFPGYFERATCVSFQMDGVPLAPEEFAAALARGAASRACRTRSAQRARNHVAILRCVESLLRRGQPLQTCDVVRWYTSIACGLSAGGIAENTLGRIDRIVSAVNSPRLRFWPAVQEVAALHVNLLADPFVPGFNGILARLLLRYHMGRCGLPPVLFDPATDPPRLGAASTLEPRLLELIVQSYDGNGRA